MRLINIQFALVKGKREQAAPRSKGQCPLCKDEVISKCGEINIWHWSHKNLDCDTFGEPETPWHINWKEQFPKERREVVIGNHRADVCYKENVIEFQNKTLQTHEIIEREQHYNYKVLWILNAEDFMFSNFDIYKKKNYIAFRWKWARKSWEVSKCKILLDFGEEYLFLIKKIYWNGKVHGYGKYWDRKKLKSWLYFGIMPF